MKYLHHFDILNPPLFCQNDAGLKKGNTLIYPSVKMTWVFWDLSGTCKKLFLNPHYFDNLHPFFGKVAREIKIKSESIRAY